MEKRRRFSIGLVGVGTLLALLCPGGSAAQRPTLSPTITRAPAERDTLAVWLFASRDQRLSDLAEQVVAIGGRVRRTSRWLRAVSAEVPITALRPNPSIRARHIQRVGKFVRESETETRREARPPGLYTVPEFGPSEMPLRVLDVLPIIDRGFTGAGVTIGILDSGFETGRAEFADATVLAQRDFIFNDSVVANQFQDADAQSRHGTAIWSLLAANALGNVIGIAPDARYLLAKTEDIRSETRVEEDNFVAAVEWAVENGADILTASVNYLTFDDGFSYSPGELTGDIAVTTIAADSAVARGVVFVTSAGNRGPGRLTIATPADGDSVIAVGAVDSTGQLAEFSSRGPTSDNRVKPDFVAPGVDVYAVDTQASTGFSRYSGTSLAAPLIAGIVALLKQIHPALGPIEIREALRLWSSNNASPSFDIGWGIPSATASATFPLGVALTSPSGPELRSITPTVAWAAEIVAPFALPINTRFRVARGFDFSAVVIDTLVQQRRFTIIEPQPPGATLAIEITINTADGLQVVVQPERLFTSPPWATLLTLDDPVGLTIRDERPTFIWTSPGVVTPPGPFTYDLTVIQDENDAVVLNVEGIADTIFVPQSPLERNTPYRWQLDALLEGFGSLTRSRGTFVVVDDSQPFATLLFQNFPNPFPNVGIGQSTTCLWFDLASAGPVRLDILDIGGHRIRNLVPSSGFPERLEAGRYGRPASSDPSRCDPRLEWDGRDSSGNALPRGVYLARLRTPDGVLFKRIVFLGIQ